MLINVCSKLQYAEILLIFLMSISYSVLAPLVIPFAVLYFGFGYVTWMNQLLFVYVPKWEGHGQMWPIIFHRYMYDVLQGFYFLSFTLFLCLSVVVHLHDAVRWRYMTTTTRMLCQYPLSISTRMLGKHSSSCGHNTIEHHRANGLLRDQPNCMLYEPVKG